MDNVIDKIIESIELYEGDPPKKIIAGVTVAKEIKQSKEMLEYGRVTPTGINFFGLEFIEDSSISKDSLIIK